MRHGFIVKIVLKSLSSVPTLLAKIVVWLTWRRLNCTCKFPEWSYQELLQAPDSEPSLTPVFLSSTCFRPPGAAQQQSGFLNFTSGSVWKWRLQWRSSGSPWNDLLHTARLLMRLDTPLHGNNARGAKYAVYYASVTTHTVLENIKMAALRAMSD